MFLFGKKKKEEPKEEYNIDAFAYVNGRTTAMIVKDVFTIPGRGTVVCGKACLILSVGDSVANARTDESFEIVGIEKFSKVVDSVNPDDMCGIFLKNATSQSVQKGDVLVAN